MVMEEGFSTDGDYKIEEGYFKIVEEAYDLLEDIKFGFLEDVIEESSVYENRNEIIHELSDMLTRHSKIKKYKIENFKVTKAELEEIPKKSIKDSISKAKSIKNREQKIALYEHAAESALINAGVFGNKAYINFGKKKYLEASDLWKELHYPAESYIDLNLSKKFEYYTIILKCVALNGTIKKVEEMIMQSEDIFNDMIKQGGDKVDEIITHGEDIINSTIDKVTKDFEDYMRSQNQYKKRILSEKPYLQELRNEESQKFFNVLKPVLKKKINLVEEKIMNYFNALRDSYVNKDDELVELCISEIKKEVVHELGRNSVSIFGWPKEQTEGNIAKWINAYINIGKSLDCYPKKDCPNTFKDSKN